jgi:signal transduction histidine kinase
MQSVTAVLGYLNLALFTLVGLVALREWRRRRFRAGLWAALAFGALAFVVDVGRLLPEEPRTNFDLIASKTVVAALVLFPYLFYRFTTAFAAPSRLLERLLVLMTSALIVATYAAPKFPAAGEPRPTWFWVYLAAFVVHWTVLAVIVAIRLWRGARAEPSVARRRMRMFAFAATAITVALIVAAAGPDEDSPLQLVIGGLATASALAFLLGLSPPVILRILWRRPEQRRTQAAVTRLMSATSEEQVAREVLAPMAGMVGARTVSLRDQDGRLIGSFGVAPDDALEADVDHVRIEIPNASLEVWRSSYAPFFGTEELRMLEGFGNLTGLALDRVRLERAARHALKQADELKTHFVSLAAHELRTPVTSVRGIVQTLYVRAEQLPSEQRRQLKQTLSEQAERMAMLVEQLLDLSRLDAEAVRLQPRPVAVRKLVEDVARGVAGERVDEVAVDVPEDLQAELDRTAFERIVSNLIGNALKYGEPPVVVRAEQRDRHFRLSVEDRGPGVAPELVPELFDRFTRGREGRAQVPGSGLGLAISRSYARAHRGDLLYEPARPGARFELVLPREWRAEGR